MGTSVWPRQDLSTRILRFSTGSAQPGDPLIPPNSPPPRHLSKFILNYQISPPHLYDKDGKTLLWIVVQKKIICMGLHCMSAKTLPLAQGPGRTPCPRSSSRQEGTGARNRVCDCKRSRVPALRDWTRRFEPTGFSGRQHACSSTSSKAPVRRWKEGGTAKWETWLNAPTL